MLVALARFPNEGRKIKYFIQGLIMSDTVTSVSRINYVKTYSKKDDKFTNAEEKLLLINFPIKNKEKLTAYFKKNHPSPSAEIIFVKPEEVGTLIQ